MTSFEYYRIPDRGRRSVCTLGVKEPTPLKKVSESVRLSVFGGITTWGRIGNSPLPPPESIFVIEKLAEIFPLDSRFTLMGAPLGVWRTKPSPLTVILEEEEKLPAKRWQVTKLLISR